MESFYSMSVAFSTFLILALSLPLTLATDQNGIYRIGVGISDITGPPAGVVLNGHLRPTLGAGIHTRQYARAFLVESETSGNVIAFVTCDMGMIDHSMKSEVVKALAVKHGNKFNTSNILISGTHTHSGVSGFMTYYSYLVIESYGFNPITYWAAVNGITEAIDAAASSLVSGHVLYGSGELLNANQNRRMDQYNMNPEEERNRYEYTVDKEMIMLKFETVEAIPIGAFSWYPLHPLSFNQRETNPLVCSESTGYAATVFDKEMNTAPGSKFVSAFASTNLGDVSPNNNPSEGRIELDEDMAKLKNNGDKLMRKAKEIFNNVTNFIQLTGPVSSVHQYVDTATVRVEVGNENLTLCSPALGFGYVQLDPVEMPWLETIRDLIKEPSAEMVECQKPKIVALAAGEMFEPWPWAPATVEVQVFQLGPVNIVGLPGEFTTMAGRRVRNAVESSTGNKVILAGLSNNYINYVATPEEYDLQKYEAGATIYGRNTLPVLTALFEDMAKALAEDNSHQIPEGQEPPSLLDMVRPSIPSREDSQPPEGQWFGDVVLQVESEYILGNDSKVEVHFIAGSPRNSPLRKGTFLTVELFQSQTNSWVTQRTDADIDTVMFWNYSKQLAEITWFLNGNETPGMYRIRHFGYYRLIEDGPSTNYLGSSGSFALKSGDN